MDTDSKVSLTGDADLIYHAPVDLLRPEDEFNLLNEDVCRRLQPGNSQTINGWQCRPATLDNMMRGQSVLSPPQPPQELVGVFELGDHGRGGMKKALRARLQKAGLACADQLELKNVKVFLFSTVTLSISVHLQLACGWKRHADQLLTFFGPKARRENKGARVITDLLQYGDDDEAVRQNRRDGPVTQLCQQVASVAAEVTSQEGLDVLADIPYYHVLYAGLSDVERPGTARLAEPFRKLLYLPGPAEPQSQSPHLGEFVFLGDAFSIIAYREMDDGMAYAEAVSGVSDMIQICEFQYRQLARACDALQRRLHTKPEKRTVVSSIGRLIKNPFFSDRHLESLYVLESRLQIRYDETTTSTFSRNHRILRLRDALLTRWGVSSLYQRANNLISAVRAAETRRRDRLVWGMNVALSIIAFLAIVDTLDAIFNIYEKLFGKS
jgi:hypothetical protein